jgi:hypothetical protein
MYYDWHVSFLQEEELRPPHNHELAASSYCFLGGEDLSCRLERLRGGLEIVK